MLKFADMANNHHTKVIKILMIAKSVDGGTGTFLFDLLRIKNFYSTPIFEVKTLILEKPTYRSSDFNAEYFSGKQSYPEYYRPAFKNVITVFKELSWIRNKIKDFKPQIVLAVDMRCNLHAIACKIMSLGRLKIVATNHIDLNKTIYDKSTVVVRVLLRMAVKYFYDKADVIVGGSKGLSDNLKLDFGLSKNPKTIYYGLDFTNFSYNLTPYKNKKVIVSIARLDKQKDHENLIDAFNLLQDRLPNTELWILSDGPKRRRLEKYVRSLKLQNKVLFMGWVKNIRPYITKSNIFVLSSKREGFGYVLIEAMQYGIPVISTDTPCGPGEILDRGKYGILVPMGQPEILCQKMFYFLTNRQKYNYFSKKSLERSKFFSMDKMIDQYKKVFVSLSRA